MTDYQINKTLWNSVSEEERDKIVRILRERGRLSDRDSVLAASEEEPLIELDIQAKAGCPKVCERVAQFVYEICLRDGNTQKECAECAEDEYMECCLRSE